MELLKGTDDIVKTTMIKADIVISQKMTGISSIVIKYLRILTKQIHIIYNGGNVCKF